jgi:hypothetical protein
MLTEGPSPTELFPRGGAGEEGGGLAGAMRGDFHADGRRGGTAGGAPEHE